MKHEETIRTLREMADWIEQNQDILPEFLNFGISAMYNGENAKDRAALVAKAMGKARKRPAYGADDLILYKMFGGNDLKVWFHRDAICERVVLGTRVIPAEPERIIPAQPEREEEIVEWKCSPVLEVQA